MQYNALAESEELSTSHGDGDQHFDRFDLMDGVLALPTSEESCVFASPRPLASPYGPLSFLSTTATHRTSSACRKPAPGAPRPLPGKRVERMLERLGQEPFLPIGNRGDLR